jgi:hypothetical protein
MVMFENLNQPYPFNNNFKHNLRTISFVSMGFMLIVLYFQPFGINFLATSRDGYFVLVMGLVSAATFFFSTLILPGLFQKLFESARWTIRKELIWNTGMFVVLAAGFSFSALGFRISGLQSLTLFRSGALALLPLILFNLLNYNRSLKDRVVHAIDSGRHWLAEERKSPHQNVNEHIRIESESGKEVFEGELRDIILIQSASNYIEIFYRDSNVVRKQLVRQTLTTVESQLSAFPNMRKCHRCCLVNTNQISKLTGTSPSYTLEAEGLDFRIPVSRQNVAGFRKVLSLK